MISSYSINGIDVASTVHDSVSSNTVVRSPLTFGYYVQQHQQQQQQHQQQQQQHQQQQLSVKLEEPPPAHAQQLPHSKPYYEEYRRAEPAERLDRPTVVSLGS